jgi:16S rRNA (uracil1498-N3)-methyltransferase
MNLVLLEPADFTGNDGHTVRLSGRRLEHVVSVCRCDTGATLRVGLLGGKTGTGTILRMDSTAMELSVALTEEPPPPLPLTLVIALPRPKSLKRSIEMATSLGVKRIVIIGSWRVEKSYWYSPVLSEESLRKHMRLGLEQARDTLLPEISQRKRFKPFVEDELPEMVRDRLALVAHPYNAKPCPFSIDRPALLVIGPEGGFIPYEIDLLVKAGCEPVTLGQRILRVETAIAAFTGRLW